jgi:electron transfer flavoprotein beta subunit
VATAQTYAALFASPAAPITPDTLVLPGSQAIDDLEGELGAHLAEALQLPYLGVVCGVKAVDGKVLVQKEFAGGLKAEFEVALPAVLGIQSAEKPPRYVPVAKVRAVMKSAKIESVELDAPQQQQAVELDRLYKPEVAGRAQMLEGSVEEIADRLADILAERGII